MADPETISADYVPRPSELAATLALLVVAEAGRADVDIRALLLDPVDPCGLSR